MPEYRYQAIDKRGRSMNGNMLAHDETDLQKKLKDLGLWLTESVTRSPGTTAAESKWALAPGTCFSCFDPESAFLITLASGNRLLLG